MKSLGRDFGEAALTCLFSWAHAAGETGRQIPAKTGQAKLVADWSVSADDLLTQPPGENWTSYNADYTGRRYSSLHEITPKNVAQLRAAWIFHPSNSERLEVTPLVVSGVMYVTSANDAYALDARTGRVLWHHQ